MALRSTAKLDPALPPGFPPELPTELAPVFLAFASTRNTNAACRVLRVTRAEHERRLDCDRAYGVAVVTAIVPQIIRHIGWFAEQLREGKLSRREIQGYRKILRRLDAALDLTKA